MDARLPNEICTSLNPSGKNTFTLPSADDWLMILSTSVKEP